MSLTILKNRIPWYESRQLKTQTAHSLFIFLPSRVARVAVSQAFRDALANIYRSSKQSKQVKRLLEKEGVDPNTAANLELPQPERRKRDSARSQCPLPKTTSPVQQPIQPRVADIPPPLFISTLPITEEVMHGPLDPLGPFPSLYDDDDDDPFEPVPIREGCEPAMIRLHLQP
jgi:hypothetical protein